jgi:hypothetical protein
MKTIIEMAREVYGEHTFWTGPQLERLERFATLIRADEREACAKVCEKAIASIWEYNPEDVKQTGTNVCNNLAAVIRARG